MKNNVNYKLKRIVRVVCTYHVGDSCGTGFFIKNTGELLTCSHVIFGMSLEQVRNHADFKSITGNDEHQRLQQFYNKKIKTLQVELSNGQIVNTDLIKFDEKFDIALLKTQSKSKVNFFELDTKSDLKYDNNLFFCGYQYSVGYNPSKYPLAVNTATVSSFPEVIIGGEKYEHVQINSINLGGNSGAPIFKVGSNKVIGIVNGNMNWGADNLAYINNINNQIYKNSLRVPLSIAYITPLKLLKSKTSIID